MSLLGPLDEHLNHQTSRPFLVPGSTDHRFYDRHWFEVVHPTGELLLLCGIGIYKNMGVADGFLVVQHQRQQTNVRVSRPLGQDPSATVGPLSIEVLEPYERIRLRLAAGDHPLAADLSWASTSPAHLEAPHFTFRDGRVVQDTSRYDQLGSLSGWVDLDGVRFNSDDWWGVRDHSWGVRPDIGGFEPKHGHPPRSSFLWLWASASTPKLSLFFQYREDGDGRQQHLDGVVVQTGAEPGLPVPIERIEHDITFIPGSRDWTALVYRLHLADGRLITVEAEALQSAWAYRGTGYENGYFDSLGVGVPRGTAIEADVIDLTVPGNVTKDGVPYFPGHREQPARVRIDGVPGTAHLPVMSAGRVQRYGLGLGVHRPRNLVGRRL
ncbi:hypothetical protein [Parafrankia sp. EUN1f]|uniref:hypothetical protein n=1 Tax=Parafrankia sp. EUN1f TaxID=102897 RepID=UPI0001C43AA8|nr:hypothetical protein [Parafrankia sp. EUN1f]EFC83468.1 hypothetical protein FrEUN1fDRAFT_3367 [Parafrankia sp. EUN1f]